ncbi:hypothetical protein LSUB1_G007352 [Lachnellula subtilissima]|uniref:Mating-type switching protein swi10 n=1 Tax=Lachnellula subtilissima TaxID=602034 RepID=A0A8H8RG11_9HELO|nr:hypothetical protein LSUB1_G007352 [Lachnellula subtilissima]
MAFLLYMLGMAHHQNSDVPTTSMQQNKERRRLQKPPRAFRPYNGADDVLTDQGHSQLQKTGNTSEVSFQHLAIPNNVLEVLLSNHSNEALSHYSGDEMDAGDCKRRRCKTPVLYVGQLESEPLEIDVDPAKCYADQYRAELPPRVYTPSIEPQLAKPRRRLRKVKSQLSLRDTIKAHARSNSSISSCETLVGLDSPQSAASTMSISPTKSYFEIEKLHLVDKPYTRILPPDSQAWNADADAVPEPDNDIALQMCTTLLSNELATVLSKQHPREQQDRTSGLQILLMIEAYEAMQQQVRQDLYESQFTGQTCQLKGLDSILDHWVDTLYAMYEQTQKTECEKIDEVVEIEQEVEDWPLRQSVMSPAPYVNQRGWF